MAIVINAGSDVVLNGLKIQRRKIYKATDNKPEVEQDRSSARRLTWTPKAYRFVG